MRKWRLILGAVLSLAAFIAVGRVLALNWTPEQEIGEAFEYHDLAIGNRGLYLGWIGASNVAYYRTYVSSVGWGTPITIAGDADQIQIAASDTGAAAVYSSASTKKLFYAQLDTTVITTEIGLPAGQVSSQLDPNVSLGPEPHVAWGVFTGAVSSLYYTNLYTGSTWLTPTEVYSVTGRLVGSPAIVASSDKVYLAWEDQFLDSNVMFSEGTVDSFGQVNWTTPISLNTGLPVTLTYHARPTLSLGDQYIYVAWAAASSVAPLTSTQYVYVSSRAISGGSWTSPLLVDAVVVRNIATTYPLPRLAVGGGMVHLVWHGQHEEAGGEGEDSYYVSFPVGGSTLGSQMNLSDTPNEMSIRPVIACSGTVCDVIWQQGTSSPRRLRWRRSLPKEIFLPVIMKSYP